MCEVMIDSSAARKFLIDLAAVLEPAAASADAKEVLAGLDYVRRASGHALGVGGPSKLMKREAMAHTKTKRLCRRMNLEQWQAVGLLESIWHLTAREAPRGDIGKLSDEDIALAIDFRGDQTVLIDALVSSGWLDRHATERLLVHDWSDHADDAVHMWLARAQLYFADGRAPKISKLTGVERERAHSFYNRAHHANLRTAMRYGHLSQEHLDRSMVLYGVEPSKHERVQSGSNDPATFGDSSPVSVSKSKVQ